jgi:hypothetical protein
MKAAIHKVSSLKKEEIGKIGLKYSKDIESAIERGLKTHGSDARILILPNGPQILPYIPNK